MISANRKSTVFTVRSPVLSTFKEDLDTARPARNCNLTRHLERCTMPCV